MELHVIKCTLKVKINEISCDFFTGVLYNSYIAEFSFKINFDFSPNEIYEEI